MPLNHQMKEISKWNTLLFSCAAQVQEQYQKIICKSSGQYKYCRWPILSVEENELHSGNITCGGCHRRYKRRSIDTDYRSNCITVTVFIGSYIYLNMQVLSAQNQSQLCIAINISSPLVRQHSHSLLPLDSRVWRSLTQYILNPAWVDFRTTCPVIKQMSFLCSGQTCKSWSLQRLE